MERNALTQTIIVKAIEIHKELGPGLLESAYQKCLSFELTQAGFLVETEKELAVTYKELKIKPGYRIDLLVENRIVVEVKHVETLTELHTAQVLTYMKFGQYDTGLLLNFNNRILKNGIRRLVL